MGIKMINYDLLKEFGKNALSSVASPPVMGAGIAGLAGAGIWKLVKDTKQKNKETTELFSKPASLGRIETQLSSVDRTLLKYARSSYEKVLLAATLRISTVLKNTSQPGISTETPPQGFFDKIMAKWSKFDPLKQFADFLVTGLTPKTVQSIYGEKDKDSIKKQEEQDQTFKLTYGVSSGTAIILRKGYLKTLLTNVYSSSEANIKVLGGIFEVSQEMAMELMSIRKALGVEYRLGINERLIKRDEKKEEKKKLDLPVLDAFKNLTKLGSDVFKMPFNLVSMLTEFGKSTKFIETWKNFFSGGLFNAQVDTEMYKKAGFTEKKYIDSEAFPTALNSIVHQLELIYTTELGSMRLLEKMTKSKVKGIDEQLDRLMKAGPMIYNTWAGQAMTQEQFGEFRTTAALKIARGSTMGKLKLGLAGWGAKTPEERLQKEREKVAEIFGEYGGAKRRAKEQVVSEVSSKEMQPVLEAQHQYEEKVKSIEQEIEQLKLELKDEEASNKKRELDELKKSHKKDIEFKILDAQTRIENELKTKETRKRISEVQKEIAKRNLEQPAEQVASIDEQERILRQYGEVSSDMLNIMDRFKVGAAEAVSKGAGLAVLLSGVATLNPAVMAIGIGQLVATGAISGTIKRALSRKVTTQELSTQTTEEQFKNVISTIGPSILELSKETESGETTPTLPGFNPVKGGEAIILKDAITSDDYNSGVVLTVKAVGVVESRLVEIRDILDKNMTINKESLLGKIYDNTSSILKISEEFFKKLKDTVGEKIVPMEELSKLKRLLLLPAPPNLDSQKVDVGTKTGGIITGPYSKEDNIPIMAQSGEVILPRSVSKPLLDFFKDIKQVGAKAAEGGVVGTVKDSIVKKATGSLAGKDEMISKIKENTEDKRWTELVTTIKELRDITKKKIAYYLTDFWKDLIFRKKKDKNKDKTSGIGSLIDKLFGGAFGFLFGGRIAAKTLLGKVGKGILRMYGRSLSLIAKDLFVSLPKFLSKQLAKPVKTLGTFVSTKIVSLYKFAFKKLFGKESFKAVLSGVKNWGKNFALRGVLRVKNLLARASRGLLNSKVIKFATTKVAEKMGKSWMGRLILSASKKILSGAVRAIAGSKISAKFLASKLFSGGAGGGMIGKILKPIISRLPRILGGVFKRLPGLQILFAAFDAYKGWTNAAEISGKQSPGFITKLGSGVAGIISGMTFGLISAKTIYSAMAPGIDWIEAKVSGLKDWFLNFAPIKAIIEAYNKFFGESESSDDDGSLSILGKSWEFLKEIGSKFWDWLLTREYIGIPFRAIQKAYDYFFAEPEGEPEGESRITKIWNAIKDYGSKVWDSLLERPLIGAPFRLLRDAYNYFFAEKEEGEQQESFITTIWNRIKSIASDPMGFFNYFIDNIPVISSPLRLVKSLYDILIDKDGTREKTGKSLIDDLMDRIKNTSLDDFLRNILGEKLYSGYSKIRDWIFGKDKKSAVVNKEILEKEKTSANSSFRTSEKGTTANNTTKSLIGGTSGGIMMPKESTPTKSTGKKESPSLYSRTKNYLFGDSKESKESKKSSGDLVQVGKYKTTENVINSIKKASEQYGLPYEFMLAVAAKESSLNPNAKASTSSATGLYQFITKTWKDLFPGKKPEDRLNPEFSADAAARYFKQNIKVLPNEYKNDPSAWYMTHFMGPGGARNFLQAYKEDPNQPPENVLSKGQIRANESLLGGDTLSDAYSKITNSFKRILESIGVSSAYASEDASVGDPSKNLSKSPLGTSPDLVKDINKASEKKTDSGDKTSKSPLGTSPDLVKDITKAVEKKTDSGNKTSKSPLGTSPDLVENVKQVTKDTTSTPVSTTRDEIVRKAIDKQNGEKQQSEKRDQSKITPPSITLVNKVSEERKEDTNKIGNQPSTSTPQPKEPPPKQPSLPPIVMPMNVPSEDTKSNYELPIDPQMRFILDSLVRGALDYFDNTVHHLFPFGGDGLQSNFQIV